jgi:transposase InsO family protein
MKLLQSIVEEIKCEYALLPIGSRGAYLSGKADALRVSARTLLRYIKPAALPEQERKERPETERQKTLSEWARIISIIKKSPPPEAGEISTEQAVKIALKNNALPEDAAKVSRRTYDRLMQDMGFNRRVKPVVRFQAEYANQAHHFDASTSAYFYVKKFTKDGEAVLRMIRPAKNYKNKPLPVGQRLMIYGIVDDYSGKHICRYIAARGEDVDHSISFLAECAWPEFGLPEALLADQGVLKRSHAAQDFMCRLGVDFPEFTPYLKEVHGKIERPWRTAWQSFEKTFFAQDNWEKFEITVSELNNRLQAYLAEYNAKPHRYMKSETRQNAWHKSATERGGITALPQNAVATVFKRSKRKIAADGTLQYEGRSYTVRGCYDEWVYVFDGIFENKVIVQCIRTGEKFEAQTLRVLKLNEYKAIAETPHQKAIKARDEIKLKTALYESSSDTIIKMPAAEREREVENPLDTGRYRSAAEAMAAFRNITARIPLSPEMMTELHGAFIKNKLSKEYVRRLAEELIDSINYGEKIC